MKPQQHVAWGVIVLLFSLFSIISLADSSSAHPGPRRRILGIVWKPPARWLRAWPAHDASINASHLHESEISANDGAAERPPSFLIPLAVRRTVLRSRRVLVSETRAKSSYPLAFSDFSENIHWPPVPGSIRRGRTRRRRLADWRHTARSPHDPPRNLDRPRRACPRCAVISWESAAAPRVSAWPRVVIGAIVLVFGLIWIGVGGRTPPLRGWAWWLAVIVMVLSIVGKLRVANRRRIPV